MLTMRYRAYCNECPWTAAESWRDEENAYADLNLHVQNVHAFSWGVREEREGKHPTT